MSELDDPADDLAFRRSLPLWLARRWIAQFGLRDADALAAAANERGPICVRANRLRCDRDELARALAAEGIGSTPSTLARDGLVLTGRPNILGLESWRRGLFEVQDEASQCVSLTADAKPGELVVDLCAGSGGKTLALAADMRGQGTIVAVELAARRLRDLEVRARRAGAAAIESRCGDATDPSITLDLASRCDLVLVDAPCSELGVLRRSPDARWRLPPDAPDGFVPLQRALLARAAQIVRPGGRVVYATCSVDPAENEAIIASPPEGLETDSARHLRPDRDGCDGFFIARLSHRA